MSVIGSEAVFRPLSFRPPAFTPLPPMANASPLAVPKTYAALRLAVEGALVDGQRRVDEAKLRTYWETGWYIKEHLLLNEDRAEYGTKVMQDLARDLKADRRTLYECLKFARLFPIVSGRSQLSWAYYRKFIQVADPAQRKALMTETIKRGWTSDVVAERVAQLNAAADATAAGPSDDPRASADKVAPPRLLTPRRGTPGLHLIVERGDTLAVDLGFKLYWPLVPEQARRLAKGDIVRIAGDDSLRPAGEATKAELFTYAATLRRVVDGDTLVVALEVSPGVFMEQKLRLRDLDCPEMSTPEGRAAKRFVDALVAKTTAIVISTSKPDKYDRYLADVFLIGAEGEELFLNNALLEAGHAVPKRSWEFGDWEKDLTG